MRPDRHAGAGIWEFSGRHACAGLPCANQRSCPLCEPTGNSSRKTHERPATCAKAAPCRGLAQAACAHANRKSGLAGAFGHGHGRRGRHRASCRDGDCRGARRMWDIGAPFAFPGISRRVCAPARAFAQKHGLAALASVAQRMRHCGMGTARKSSPLSGKRAWQAGGDAAARHRFGDHALEPGHVAHFATALTWQACASRPHLTCATASSGAACHPPCGRAGAAPVEQPARPTGRSWASNELCREHGARGLWRHWP